MSKVLPFRYLPGAEDDPFSNHFSAGVYFESDVPPVRRAELTESLPLPLGFASPIWGARFLWVCSQEYPGVAIRFAYNAELAERGSNEGWGITNPELFEKVTETHDDEPTEAEEQRFLDELKAWVMQLHERQPIGLLGADGPWPMAPYPEAREASLAAFAECASHLKRGLESKLTDSPHLLGNLAYSASLLANDRLDEAGRRCLRELAKHAISVGDDENGHWKRLIDP